MQVYRNKSDFTVNDLVMVTSFFAVVCDRRLFIKRATHVGSNSDVFGRKVRLKIESPSAEKDKCWLQVKDENKLKRIWTKKKKLLTAKL